MRRRTRGSVAVGVALAMILGGAPAAVAEEAPTLAISGSVVDGDPDELHAFQYGMWDVTLHNPDVYPFTWTQRVRGSNPTFSIDVPAPGTYRAVLRAALTLPSQAWSRQNWYGDTPFESRALPIVVSDAPVSGVDIPARVGGVISGSIEGVSYHWEGLHSHSASALLLDPATGAPAEWFMTTAADDGGYELVGLPAGDYLVEMSHDTQLYEVAAREHLPEYFPSTHDIQAAQRITIAPDVRVTEIDATLEPWRYETTRLAGADRFATAVALSQSEFPAAEVVYIANGLDWPDALSAGPAAAHAGGPLLLTRPASVPPETLAELRRLSPDEIVIVGGPGVVGSAVESTLRTLAPVRRVHGSDRYATSRAVLADSFRADAPVVWMATGGGFADALSAGSAAARQDAPLLLVDPLAHGLDPSTVALLGQKAVQHVSIAGGPGALSALHEDAVRAAVSSSARYAGADRYETSWRVAIAAGFPIPLTLVRSAFLASGTSFPDALAAAPLSADDGGMVVLTRPECIPAGTDRALRTLFAYQPVIVGGQGVLGSAIDRAVVCRGH